MPAIIALALSAIVALTVLSFAVHVLFSPWLLVAIAILAWIKFRPRRSHREPQRPATRCPAGAQRAAGQRRPGRAGPLTLISLIVTPKPHANRLHPGWSVAVPPEPRADPAARRGSLRSADADEPMAGPVPGRGAPDSCA